MYDVDCIEENDVDGGDLSDGTSDDEYQPSSVGLFS